MRTTQILSLSFLSITLAAAVLNVACSDIINAANPFGEQQARCELRPGKSQCTDIRKFKGPSLVTFQGVCTSLTAASKDAGGYTEKSTCGDVSTMWGGCQTKSADGSLQTNWYYKGGEYATIDDAKKNCDSGQTWVDPA